MESTPYAANWRTRQVIIASSVILAIAAVPRFATFVRALVVGPAFVALGICALVFITVRALIQSDVRHPPASTPTLHTLVFTTPSAWSALLVKQSWEEDATASRGPPLLLAAEYTVRIALDRFLELVQRHFISPWYSRISPSRAFPNSTDILIRQVIANCVKQGDGIDWSGLLVSRIVPTVRDHLQHYRSVEHLATHSTEKISLALPLPENAHPSLSAQSHTGPGGSGTMALIEGHLRQHLDTVMERVLPETDRSEVVKVLVREIVLGAVLMPIFDMLCDGDFWNRQIDDRGGRYLHEQCVSVRGLADDVGAKLPASFRHFQLSLTRRLRQSLR